ncbi:MAG: zinc ABC transporter substrate-binding protein [Sedimentisphaerales bacterium]|nr:zinc ABC transporter substrate-binding protein [Sedimentisphaerales bacterium]
MKMSLAGAIVLAVLAVGGCRESSTPSDGADIAVTNSYLECAVRDLCGDEVKVMCLAPPGMCPGHFDISPAQVRQLRGCRVLLLFDFQQKVETSLARLKDKGLKTHLVQGPAGLCIPQAYLAVCREVAQTLSVAYPDRAPQFAERLAAVEARLAGVSDELRASVRESGAASAEILVSNHQAEFAEWLGLEPVATFVGSDIETVSNLDHCLQKAAGHNVRFVVANQQEGTSLAEALAARLGARTVVFSNFPLEVGNGAGFDELLRANVRSLLEAAAK